MSSDAATTTPAGRAERSCEPKHYQFLDALRGIAVLGVVAVHTVQNFHAPAVESFLALGQYGVQLFYIVSAFSLCLSLDQRTRNERRPLLNYGLRRFFRIAPLFYLAIAVYLVLPFVLPADAAPATPHPMTWSLKPWHVVATVLFVNGWHYQAINFVVPGCWSIAVETNFYLLLPFLFRYARSLRRTLQLLAATLVFNIAFRKALYQVVAPHVPTGDLQAFGLFSSMSLPSQLPVFTLGILMFHLFRRLPRSGTPPWRATRAVTGVALMLAMATALPAGGALNKMLPDGMRATVVLLFFSLLVAQTNPAIFVNRATVWLGRISFSVYLSHFIALHLVLWGTRAWYAPHFASRPPFALAFPAVLAITSLMSIVSYRLVEVPGQRLGRRLIRRLESQSPRPAPPVAGAGISPAL